MHRRNKFLMNIKMEETQLLLQEKNSLEEIDNRQKIHVKGESNIWMLWK